MAASNADALAKETARRVAQNLRKRKSRERMKAAQMGGEATIAATASPGQNDGIADTSNDPEWRKVALKMVVRPGPRQRAKAAVMAASNADVLAKETARRVAQNLRKRKSRERMKAAQMSGEATIAATASSGQNDGLADTFNDRERRKIALKMVDFCYEQLGQCPTLKAQREVMESFLAHLLIRLTLPEYYLPPEDAKAQAKNQNKKQLGP